MNPGAGKLIKGVKERKFSPHFHRRMLPSCEPASGNFPSTFYICPLNIDKEERKYPPDAMRSVLTRAATEDIQLGWLFELLIP